MVKRVLITGATGFLGSHLAKENVHRGNKVIATFRSSSNRLRCNEYSDLVNWIDIEETNWREDIAKIKPQYIIHTAWSGLEVGQRDDFETQTKNIQFLDEILSLAHSLEISKFIGIGSQAEYGFINQRVNENDVVEPNSAYGKTKILALEKTQAFCENKNIQWYWCRLFSVFGEMDNESWLIPWLIGKCLKNEEVKLTPGEQRYDFLYVKDIVEMLMLMLDNADAPVGIYNLSSSASITLKKIAEIIKSLSGSKSFLNFGAMRYREGQSMLIEGDNSRFLENVQRINFTPLEEGLEKTVDYYRSKQI